MNHSTTRVVQRLRTKARLFKRRNHDCAEAYLRVGEILNGIFPEGIFIKGQQKFTEIGLLVRMLDEILQAALLRFQNSIRRVKGTTTQDTLENLEVLSFMWADLIEHNAKKPSKKIDFKGESQTYPRVREVSLTTVLTKIGVFHSLKKTTCASREQILLTRLRQNAIGLSGNGLLQFSSPTWQRLNGSPHSSSWGTFLFASV